MEIPIRTKSVHMKSINPPIFLHIMKMYISSVISKIEKNCHISARDIDFNKIYNNISYPSLCNKSCKLNVELSSLKIDIPDTSINQPIYNWVKTVRGIAKIEDVIKDTNIHIKYSRTETMDRITFEYYTGIVMNKLRKKLPTFAFTLGMFNCSKPDDKGVMCSSTHDKKNEVIHIIQEKVDGQTLEYLLKNNKLSVDDIIKILLIVALSLTKAQDKKGFVHNALYACNIIIKKEHTTIGFNLGGRTYTIETDYIPVIIDYSSARTMFRGFAVCYILNPTMFFPGKDLIKLISSCLTLINTQDIYQQLSFLLKYFYELYDLSQGDYDSLLRKYNNFEILDDHPIASLSASSFVDWFQINYGVVFNKMVKITSREVRNISIDTPMRSSTSVISSGILKMFENKILSKPDYTPTLEEKKYDSDLLSAYKNYLLSNPCNVHKINYNFPLHKQYEDFSINKINIREVFEQEHINKQVLMNYVTFVRMIHTLNIDMNNIEINNVYNEIVKLRHNLHVFYNFSMRKIYNACEYKHTNNMDGNAVILSKDLPEIINWFKILHPDIGDNINIELKVNNEDLYYPTSSLQQIQMINMKRNKDLLSLVNKIILKPDANDERITTIIMKEVDDVEIYLQLKQLYVPVVFDRTAGRVKDIKKLLREKVNSYLDFGGGDGKISAAISTSLNINKSYSLDIESWFGKKVSRLEQNITYITQKENQSIDLANNSIELITALQVLHHIENVDFVLNELTRINSKFLIIREHDCRDNYDRMLIDVEHSLFEMCIEDADISYLNNYKAWYRSKGEWINMIENKGYKLLFATNPYGTTRYWYGIFRR